MHLSFNVFGRSVILMAAMLVPVSGFAQETALAATDQLATGTIEGSGTGQPLTIQPDSVNAPAVVNVNIPRYTKRFMAARVQYQPSTCKQISSGVWRVNERPSCVDGESPCGEVTFGTTRGRLANGDCPGTIFTFGAIFYEWTLHKNRTAEVGTVKDTFKATWISPPFIFPEVFNITVLVVRPDHETTAHSGWDTTGLGLWKQTLHPPAHDPTFNFGGETVQEAAAPPAGPDTCWFKGSAFSPFTAITGGTWAVNPANIWQFDHVGWFNTAITYYRAHKRAPCGTRFGQQMMIKSPADKGFVKYGKVNILGGRIGTTTVTSTRAGSSATR